MQKKCKCGCGQDTKIITKTSKLLNRTKGEYNNYIHGHNRQFKTGKDNPQYGIPNRWGYHTEETKLKLSIANKGKKLSSKTKQKISKATKGDKNPFWKGGKIARYESFAHQIEPIEKTRRNPKNPLLIQVK